MSLTSFALVLLLCAPALSQEPRTITVNGEGEVAARPDTVVILFAVVAEAGSAGEALAQAGRRTAAVLAGLKAAQVDYRDLQTSRLTVQPRLGYMEGRPPRIEGYVARNQVRAQIRPVERAGGIVDGLVASGANEIAGLAFEISDRAGKLDEARAAAAQDARRRAALYASAIGATLGKVRSIQETGASPQPAMRMQAEGMAATTPIEAGEETVSAQVTAVFEIE